MRRINSIFKILLVTSLCVAGGILSSCSKQPEPQPEYELGLAFRTSSSSKSAGYTFVSVTCPGEWTLSFEQETDWASLSDSCGTGNKSNIRFGWEANASDNARSCKLILSDGKSAVSAVFKQEGSSVDPRIESDPVCNWMELPATTDKSLYFFTHPMTIDGKKYRNYSYFWDVKALVSHWVAYPMNATLLKGSCGRSEKWGTDNKLPVEYQPVLNSGYRGVGASWDRGHQIPSADRQIMEYNIQTYYGVNMTPQNNSLNTGAWSSLEGYVRTRCRAVDTLYVVTGCVVRGSSKIAYDNVGKEVTVPVAYYKALLAYKQNMSIGITSQTGGYTGIAFYYENGPYSGNFMDASMTIDALENLTGEDFFVNLPSAVGDTKASKAESSMDDWWKK